MTCMTEYEEHIIRQARQYAREYYLNNKMTMTISICNNKIGDAVVTKTMMCIQATRQAW